jgi:undecaprenyl pyrophosphate phosphatase UppP
MEIIRALILGLVQGLTEFLPISSSGHLLILEKFGLGSPSVFFNLALHAGTLLSAVVFYRKKILEIIKKPLGKDSLCLAAATAATGILAFAAKRFFGAVLEGQYLAIGFTATAVLLFSVEAFGADAKGNGGVKSGKTDGEKKEKVGAKRGERDNKNEIKGGETDGKIGDRDNKNEIKSGKTDGNIGDTDGKGFNISGKINKKAVNIGEKSQKKRDISLKNAVICGLCQGIAVAPGLSRSGATIASLLFMGADREKAANFSFMLSMPVIAAGFVLETMQNQAFLLPQNQIFSLLAGMAAAAVSGFFAIKLFVRLLKKKSMKGFAYYAAALAIFCGAAFGVV